MLKNSKIFILIINIVLIKIFSVDDNNKINNLYQKYNVYSNNYIKPIHLLKDNLWGNDIKNRRAKISLQQKKIGVPAEFKPVKNNKKNKDNNASNSIHDKYSYDFYDNNEQDYRDESMSHDDLANLLAEFKDDDLLNLLADV